MENTATTHCQICGRAIKSKNGIIAHHGYTRPQGYHYQTRSCFGARYRPYEIAHDAIDVLIPNVTDWLASAEADLVIWTTTAPDTITYIRKDAYGRERVNKTFPRPEGFDPATAYDSGTMNSGGDYAGLYFNGKRERTRNVAALREELAYLTQRRADWHPAAG